MTEAVLPYEATVDGVRNRVREVARPTGTAPVGGAARDERIADPVIAEWLLEAGAKVARKLRLIDTLGKDETSPLRREYRLAARGLVELYAAALLWDATFPQAAKGERYGAVLYERYEKGLTELAGDLAVDHAAQEVAVVDDGNALTDELGGTGASARFPVPDPRISRYAPW